MTRPALGLQHLDWEPDAHSTLGRTLRGYPQYEEWILQACSDSDHQTFCLIFLKTESEKSNTYSVHIVIRSTVYSKTPDLCISQYSNFCRLQLVCLLCSISKGKQAYKEMKPSIEWQTASQTSPIYADLLYCTPILGIKALFSVSPLSLPHTEY